MSHLLIDAAAQLSIRPARPYYRRIAPLLLALLLACASLLGASPQTAQAQTGGPVVLMGIDAEDGGPGGHGPISVYEDIVDTIHSQATGGSGILVIGGGKSSTDSVTRFWNAIASGTGIAVTYVNGAAIGTQSFTPFRMLAVVSDQANTPSGGLNAAENTLLTGRQSDIADFVNNGGGLLGFSNDFAPPYGYLSGVGTFVVRTAQFYDDITPTPEGAAIGITNALDVVAWHDIYDVFPSFLSVLATVNEPTQPLIHGDPAAIGGQRVIIPPGITLEPGRDTNPAGTSHTVTATVTIEGAPAAGELVNFDVTAGPNTGQQSPPGCTVDPTCRTDANGQVSWTYVSNGQTGTDTIQACFTDPGGRERCAEAFKTWVAGAPASLTLTPPTDTNAVGEQHCVTATVRDAFGNPVPGVTVRFSVGPGVPMTTTFPSPSSGSAVTDSNGQATFCYTASLPGADTIHAYADVNNNNVQETPPEPFGDATKLWTPPRTTELCEVKITDGGWIIAVNNDRANFGGNANSLSGPVKGQQEYQDKGPAQPMNVHSIELTAITCNNARTTASIFGTATIDGTGEHVFKIDVTDMSKIGGTDSYGMTLDTGYMSGQQVLSGGQITIH